MSLHHRSEQFGFYAPPLAAPYECSGAHVTYKTEENEVSRFPGEVSGADKHDEVSEKIEDFLDANADLFGHSLEAWRAVKAAQQKAVSPNEEEYRGQVAILRERSTEPVAAMTSRQQQRIEDKAWAIAGMTAILSGSRNDSATNFNNNILPGLTAPDRLTRQYYAASRTQAMREQIQRQYQIAGQLPHQAAANANLQAAYIDAYYADYEVLHAVEEFLTASDDALPAFVDRISELARHARKGAAEYPGLLEVLAVNNHQFGDKSVLNEAVNRIIGQSGNYAAAFLEHCFDAADAGTLKKDMTNAMGTIQLVAKAIAVNMDREVLIEVLAARWESWPPVLAEALAVYAKGRSGSYRQHMKNALEPFVRQGRLPGKGAIITSQGKRRQATHKKGKRIRSAGEVDMAANSQDMTDVSVEEVPRIGNIAWLAKLGTGSRNAFVLEQLNSVEDIMKIGHFQKYLETHRHDPTVAVRTREALHFLLSNPYNSAHTKKWKGSTSMRFWLNGNTDRMHNMRRISLRDLPGETKAGEVAARTRIAYGVAEEDGKLYLAVYGIFLKQDIEYLNALPPRK